MILPEIIENFVSKETCDYLNKSLSIYAPVDVNGYSNIYVDKTSVDPTENYFFNTMNQTNAEQIMLKDLINLIQQSAVSNFDIKKSAISLDRVNYRTFKDGQFFHYHIDQCGEGGPLYTALLYLNEDYEGGDIVFYDIETGQDGPSEAFHPKPGTLLCFKGDHTSPHEVLPVISGVRANIAMNFRLHEDRL
jgi:predicted 2-oxoglutarate/Fe(II)-dependent dioxygenase YbiX